MCAQVSAEVLFLMARRHRWQRLGPGFVSMSPASRVRREKQHAGILLLPGKNSVETGAESCEGDRSLPDLRSVKGRPCTGNIGEETRSPTLRLFP